MYHILVPKEQAITFSKNIKFLNLSSLLVDVYLQILIKKKIIIVFVFIEVDEVEYIIAV